ncbi:MAG: hypothetical protein AAF226_01330 [Verrucomicrobiota bacterium]
MRETADRSKYFSAVAFAGIGVCFLVLFYDSIVASRNWAVLPKIVAALISPIPITLMAGFCLADKAGEKRELRIRPLPIIGAIFTGVLVAVPCCRLGDSLVPLLIESAVFTASLINFFVARSASLAGLLCGLSVGITAAVIWLS